MKMEMSFPGGKQVNAMFGGRIIQTDQPIDDGGSGSAPAPFELFLASIGTCTGYFVLSFCQRNDIPTEGLRLLAHFERNPGTHLVEQIRIEIQLPLGFPEKYKKAVVKVAEACSVKRNMDQPPRIDISVVE
jgi:ribosomal protein S12 methylthiotransferase accessory factor